MSVCGSVAYILIRGGSIWCVVGCVGLGEICWSGDSNAMTDSPLTVRLSQVSLNLFSYKQHTWVHILFKIFQMLSAFSQVCLEYQLGGVWTNKRNLEWWYS